MRKNEIICAFYNPDVEHFEQYHSFMKVVVENKEKIKPLYFEDNEGMILIVFYRHRLKRILKLLSDADMDFYENIMAGKCRRCCKCECSYLSYIPYTYRDNCGCSVRSYECEVCQAYSDNAVRQIRDYARKHGAKKTLLKVLNDEFIKDESLDLDEELPF